MRPMRPGPRGKRGWRSAGNPSGLRNERAGGGLAGCRARMRGNDHEAQRRYQGWWPLSGECEQNARLFCERCSTRRSGTPPAERRPPPDGGRPALRAPLPRRRRCRPLRRLRRRMPGLFGSLWQHTRDCPQQENPSFGAPSGAESLAELVNLLAPIRTGLRVPGSGHRLVATAGAPPRRRPEPRAR